MSAFLSIKCMFIEKSNKLFNMCFIIYGFLYIFNEIYILILLDNTTLNDAEKI